MSTRIVIIKKVSIILVIFCTIIISFSSNSWAKLEEYLYKNYERECNYILKEEYQNKAGLFDI